MSRALVVAIAVLALFACTFASAQEVAAPRFAEVEAEDAAVLAEQQKAFEATLDQSQIEEEDSDESESESEDADEESADEEDADEADEESEAEDESEEEESADEESEDLALLEVADENAEEAEAEAEEEESSEDEESDEAEEEADEEAEEESEAEDESEEEESDEAEEEEESEGEAETEFVLAELQENYLTTGFMETAAEFKPTQPVAAEHLVHSLSSHQQAIAQQEYVTGYAHGHADAVSADEEGEASFVEADAAADAEHPSATYVSSNGQPYYASYPAHVANIQPFYGGVPVPPQLPSWLPPPPYVTPVAPKDKSE